MVCAALLAAVVTAAPRPNFVLVLIDDLGWKDFGIQGTTIYRTPNIDRFAQEGLRFKQSYAAASVCSPTRASIMTGQNPARVGITDWLPGANFQDQKLLPAKMPDHLPYALTTLPELLRGAGYATWNVGKWHLGGLTSGPTAHGFDVNIAGSHTGHPATFFYPYGNDQNHSHRVQPLDGGKPGEYLTDRLTDEAIQLIGRKDDRPFFLMLSHYTVHMPLEAKAEDFAKYKALVGPDFPKRRATYAAMVDNLDQNIGRLMKTLQQSGLDRNTLVLITSDNGGLHDLTDNRPLRMGKGYLYEGGIRVPLLARWPGTIAAGRVAESPVISTDTYATFADLAGAKLPKGQPQDGRSFASLLTGGGTRPKDRVLGWHYPHYHTADRPPCSALRAGDWKLVRWYETRKEELYNLALDPGEGQNLARQEPAKTLQMSRQLDAWLKGQGAKLALPNPQFKPGQITHDRPEVVIGECSCRLSVYRD